MTDASSSRIPWVAEQDIGEDFDGDGDKDLVVDNLGLNALFHAEMAEEIF